MKWKKMITVRKSYIAVLIIIFFLNFLILGKFSEQNFDNSFDDSLTSNAIDLKKKPNTSQLFIIIMYHG